MVIPARIELASQVPQTCILPLNYGIRTAAKYQEYGSFCQFCKFRGILLKLFVMKLSLEQLQVEIAEIQARNERVEKDKAWETSWFRKILIAVLTYAVIVIFFFFAELPKPFINAIVPAIAFLLSTMSVSIFKKWWLWRR